MPCIGWQGGKIVGRTAYITKHAIERFRMKTRTNKDNNEIIFKIVEMLNRAESVEPDPEYRVKSLIRHGFRETEYYALENWVFVIVNDSLTTLFQRKISGKRWWWD